MTRSEVPDFVAVIVAAGQASRFGHATPKQFHELGGVSVLERSVRAVAGESAVAGVVIVLPADDVDGEWGTAARR